jgi:hypothetical protein
MEWEDVKQNNTTMKHIKANKMSLLEKLKPKYLKMLKDGEINYPYSAKKLQDDLSEINNWVELKYSSAVHLVIYLNTNDYSPTGIDNLFSDEEH